MILKCGLTEKIQVHDAWEEEHGFSLGMNEGNKRIEVRNHLVVEMKEIRW